LKETAHFRRAARSTSAAVPVTRLGGDWEFLSGGIDPVVSNNPDDPIAVYDLRRR
jgi:hypothetical protein